MEDNIVNLSEEELVRRIRPKITDASWSEGLSIEEHAELCRIRWGIWKGPMGLAADTWDAYQYCALMEKKSLEEILEMIARARLEEEI